jgi:hypothetical protein
VALAFAPALWICGIGMMLLVVVMIMVKTRTMVEEPTWWRRDLNPQLRPTEELLGLSGLVLIALPLIVAGIRGIALGLA